MADAFTAIGLVGNIVQFVDFGTRLVSNTHELYKSAEGALTENVELEKVTVDLQTLLQSLKNGPLVEERALQELVETCLKLADELMVILKGLRINERKNRRLESIKNSLKTILKKGQIRDIERRLCKIRDQVCVHLNLLLSNRQAAFLPSIHDPADATETINMETSKKIDTMAVELQKFIDAKAWDKGDNNAFNTFSSLLKSFIEQAQDSGNAHRILKSLHFKRIKARQSDIKEAHRNTFEWIFKQESGVNFVPWLRLSGDIYWIAGKAGSGKSTLMKFLYSHHRTQALLREWAGNQRLIIASHFFWSAGTPMQRSQEGLFRALLFQILVQCPEIIPIVCPNRWSDNSYHSLEGWARSELLRAFNTLARVQQLSVRFCLFVDGLDEYDGEQSDIIHILRIISRSPNIKLCVSSRPWNDFIDAFDGSSWKLYVQELTSNDIRLYVKDNLEDDPRFQVLKIREDWAAQALVQQICDKAQGVFLWVYLVIRSLLRGLANEDEISDLQRRLNELPGDLETYFELMLDTIEDIYHEQTARIFKIMVNADATLPVIIFHFVDKEKQDPTYPFRQAIRPFSQPEIANIVKKKRRQLNARCKDLLQVTNNPDEPEFFRCRVGFLHRTVMDFLRTKHMDTLLTTRSGPDFSPNSALCKAYLAQIKAMPLCKRSSETPMLRDLVLGIIYYAQKVETVSGHAEHKLLDELEKTISAINKGRDNPWTGILPADDCQVFLDIAVRCGLQLYVEQKRNECSERTRNRCGLLRQALRAKICIEKDFEFDAAVSDQADISMLRFLLELGESPNQTNVGEFGEFRGTVWSDFLKQLQTDFSKHRVNAWDLTKFIRQGSEQNGLRLMSNAYEACELMILYGANRMVPQSTTTDDSVSKDLSKHLDATKLFEEIFTFDEAESLNRRYQARENRKQCKQSTWSRLLGFFLGSPSDSLESGPHLL